MPKGFVSSWKTVYPSMVRELVSVNMAMRPGSFDQHGEEPGNHDRVGSSHVDSPRETAVDWTLLARCLTLTSPNNTPLFEDSIKKACAFGARSEERRVGRAVYSGREM